MPNDTDKMLDFILTFQAAGREFGARIRMALDKNRPATKRTRNPKMSRGRANRIIKIAEELVLRDFDRQVTAFTVGEARRLYRRYGLNGERALLDLLQRDNINDRIGKIIRAYTGHASEQDRSSRKIKREVGRLRLDTIVNDLRENEILAPARLDINLYNRARMRSIATARSVIRPSEPM